MPRHHLLSTPAGLRALQDRHPVLSLQGPDGFISTEVVFLDARGAHLLQAALRSLTLAAAQVHQEAMVPRGRISRQSLTELSSALILAREWQ